MKKVEDNNTPAFIVVGVKVNRHQIILALKKLCDLNVAQVNTLISLDEEKADVRPAPVCEALYIANKIGIIYTKSSWLVLNIKLFYCKRILVLKSKSLGELNY